MSTSAKQLADFVTRHQPLTVITGAGCSLSSGIPTYRDDHGTWQRTNPIQHGEFMSQARKRQRYWARSYSGWPYVQQAKPNPTHYALAKLEKLGYLRLLVTQNVDRLHQQAGHSKVIDLHGRLDQVHCTDCYAELARSDMQLELSKQNPHLDAPLTPSEIAPDGDADVPDSLIERMTIPDCPRCGG
ncbi:MAG: Sir2 family NAD-dependent protein deacetylase, partial [Pseudomonadales bacterium]